MQIFWGHIILTQKLIGKRFRLKICLPVLQKKLTLRGVYSWVLGQFPKGQGYSKIELVSNQYWLLKKTTVQGQQTW